MPVVSRSHLGSGGPPPGGRDIHIIKGPAGQRSLGHRHFAQQKKAQQDCGDWFHGKVVPGISVSQQSLYCNSGGGPRRRRKYRAGFSSGRTGS